MLFLYYLFSMFKVFTLQMHWEEKWSHIWIYWSYFHSRRWE